VAQAGVNGALRLYSEEIRNYRDWLKIDVDLWRQFWFGMVNRGVLAMPYWWDEQWTISVQHSEADIDKHLAVFEEVAPGLAKTQQERGLKFVGAAGPLGAAGFSCKLAGPASKVRLSKGLAKGNWGKERVI